MTPYYEITRVHLEISSKCNAACPLCPRNFHGYPYNDGYPEVNMTLKQAKTIFTAEFVAQLMAIWINGNFGDFVANSESVEIVEYFRQHNQRMMIDISTNGSAGNAKFWKRLARSNVVVHFCLDGLEDTHHFYRQNTNWGAIIKNAKTFINAGGRAIWKFIEFDHNKHQIADCRQLANDLGFLEFRLIDENRNSGPVFNRHGKLVHVLGKYSGPTKLGPMLNRKNTDAFMVEDAALGKTPKNIVKCKAIEKRSIYVAATGEVSPCCWTGFSPKTYGHGEYFQAVNFQISPLIIKNNALEYPMAECIEWFSNIEDAWQHSNYEDGRLLVCDDNCGVE